MSGAPLGLYVHLPWCERKCPYCDFNSHERADLPEAAYVDALLLDLAGDAEAVGERPVRSVFIGGGTPSLFSATAIARLLRGIADRVTLAADAEITLEANPGSAEAAKFPAFRSAGVNRLSLGIQSFDDEALTRLGRVHDRAEALAALAAARQAGFDDLNLDLMHGLPGQTVAGGLADLAEAAALAPAHLSWYQLTIEPNTVFHRRPPTLPGELILGDLEHEGTARLEAAGYARYEVSAWSQPHRRCRHNLGYWTFGDYLAIGAGAHGKLTGVDGRVRRYAKRRQPEAYLAAAPGEHSASERFLSPEDLAGEFMLNALRLIDGVPRRHFAEATGLSDAIIEERVRRLVGQGLLVADPTRLATTPLGLRFLDDVVGAFF